MTEVVATNQTILVVGGGISGMTAALEAAECGKDVVLLEKIPRSAAAFRSCTGISPNCVIRSAVWKSTCAASRATAAIRTLTMAEVTGITGQKATTPSALNFRRVT